MIQLTNQEFKNINIFNNENLCITITKKICQPSFFSKPFNKFMLETHNNLNKYLNDNNYNPQSQKVIRG
ncbi:conserved hypothetical protein, partial sequence, partial [Candidatus Phytoplasma solani]